MTKDFELSIDFQSFVRYNIIRHLDLITISKEVQAVIMRWFEAERASVLTSAGWAYGVVGLPSSSLLSRSGSRCVNAESSDRYEITGRCYLLSSDGWSLRLFLVKLPAGQALVPSLYMMHPAAFFYHDRFLQDTLLTSPGLVNIMTCLQFLYINILILVQLEKPTVSFRIYQWLTTV